MSTLKSILAATALTLLTTGNAHMLLASPPPYGVPSKSPLSPDGSDYPCKANSVGNAPVTPMTIGQQQTLSFNGTAVHGGGSCQIALTKDTPATKSSKWMVIHSIHGGCPARNTAGNLAEGANPDTTPDPDTYKYTLPAGISPGAYTLAWVWYNKVGNREMYMNCAAVKVSGGGKGKRDSAEDQEEVEAFTNNTIVERATAAGNFPDLFVANIGKGCTTAEGGDVKFPNPGASVETNKGFVPKPPVGNCGGSSSSSGSDSGSSSAAGSSSEGSTSSGSGSTSGSSSAAKPPSGGSTNPDSSMAGGSSSPPSNNSPSGNTGSGASSPALPVGEAASTNKQQSASNDVPAASDSHQSGGSSDTAPCSTPGQSICSTDGTKIGTCSQAMTVTWIKLSQGTKCVGGKIVAVKRWVS